MVLFPILKEDSIQVLPVVDNFQVVKNYLKDNSGRDNRDDSFYICDVGDFVKKHKQWQKSFPRILPYYAVKCNPDPILLKTLIALGTSFDCASKVLTVKQSPLPASSDAKAEIEQMLNLGVRPNQIIFAHPCKQSSHIEFARDNHVNLVVFDSAEELAKLKEIFSTANLVLRIQTNDSTSRYRLSMKFGAPIDNCRTLIKTAKKMGLNVVGISFHVGSDCQDATAFIQPIKDACNLFDYAKTIGYNFNLLDIGGGFPGTENVKLKFEEITHIVNRQLENYFPAFKYPNLRVIAEPGRFYATSAFTLVTNIIAKRKVVPPVRESKIEERSVKSKENNQAFMYYVNDGIFGSFNFLFQDHEPFKPGLLKSLSPTEAEYPSSIWGPACAGIDRILENISLPELDAMEWITWPDMGAYTLSISSSFNGFKTTNIHHVISEKQHAALEDAILERPKFVEDIIEKL